MLILSTLSYPLNGNKMESIFRTFDASNKNADKLNMNIHFIHELLKALKDEGSNAESKVEFENVTTKSKDMNPVDLFLLPNVEVFPNDPTKENSSKFKDLCYEDSLRMSRLIEEVTKCKERNIEDGKLITNLQKEKFKLTLEMNKLDKDITELMKNNEDKNAELEQINKKYNTAVQEYKMQITEMKVKMDISEKQMSENVQELQKKNKELMITINKLNTSNNNLMFKYKNHKKKLKRALMLIKAMIKEANEDNTGNDKYCQVPSKTNSSAFIDKQIMTEDITDIYPTQDLKNPIDVQVLSELFFKKNSDCKFEDPFMFLMQENIIHNRNTNV